MRQEEPAQSPYHENVKERSLSDIWNDSQVFAQLRNPGAYEGKCGDCRYEAICGGCRARAYAATGSFLAEEPFCSYQPDQDRPLIQRQEARHDAQIH